MGTVIGIIVVLALAILFAVLTIKSKGSDNFKWIGIFIFIAFLLTWILPYGQYQNGSFVEIDMLRLGISDIPAIVYRAIYFGLTTLMYLFVLGGFYGVISKTKGYQRIVNNIAKGIKGKEILVTLILVLMLVSLTSILKTPFVMLFFIPFLVSILLNAKFDKVTVMGITFGSILVGTLAATYGTEGLSWFNNYLSTDIKVGLTYRLIFAAITLVLFIVYSILRVRKMLKNNPASDKDNDVFAVETVKDKVRIWPIVLILIFITLFIVIGYVDWETFGVEIFTKFHEWLTGLAITVGEEEYKIFAMILGNSTMPLGSLEITSLINILVISALAVVLFTGQKFSESINNFVAGLGKMAKPIGLFVLSYVVFIIVYTCPFISTVTDWAFGLTEKFNPFIATITAFLTSIFTADLGFTAYAVGSALTTTYASDLNIVHTIYIITYGLVQVLVPTSGLLLVGLSYLKVDYKSWFKYIWMFAVVMIVVLLIFVTVVTYWI